MKVTMRKSTGRFAALALALVLAGCANPVLQESSALIDSGHWREGLARLEQAMKDNPGDPELRIQYHRYRERSLQRVLDVAESELAAGRPDSAEAIYREVLAMDANHPRAASGLVAISTSKRHAVLMAEAKAALERNDSESAAQHLKTVLTENQNHVEARALDREIRERELRRGLTPPMLQSRMQNLVNLDFRDASLKLVLEAISRSSGINFVFDREVRPDLKSTIVARDVRVEDAIDMILVQNQLEKKVLSDNSMLVYPSTPQKLRENQELAMRVFHLGNADVKQTVNLLRTMIKTKDIFVDERMNMLVMRDTPDAIRLAEKLVGMHDMADPEVVLEIEILEASRNKVRDLGITYPGVFSGPSTPPNLATIDNLNRNTITVDSGFALRALRTDGDTKTLANPRVRVRNKEKARVHVGDRVPVISSTLVGTGSGGAPVSSEQIQYLDVGIKIDAEPTVHPDGTVAIRINLDVSSLGAQTRTQLGTIAYEVGTRNVNTALRLRDGETQALMGLIRDDDAQTRSGLPFIGELPVLDRIFGNTKDERRSRELVLLITPHIVRGNTPPDATLAEFWSGTEARLRSQGPFMATSEAAAAPGQAGAATSAPRAETPSLGSPAPAPLAAAAGPSALSLAWVAPERVNPAGELAVTLNAKGEGQIKGLTVSLRYQPTEAELLAVEDGGYFSRGGVEGVFTPRSEPGLGMVVASFAAAAGSVPGGEGSLLTLRLKPAAQAQRLRLGYISVVGIDAAGRQIPITGMAPLDVPIKR
jgi:general secretion pathway protein D